MITCPWCGTSYSAFQSTCEKCGGPLSPSAETASSALPELPPPAPRAIADSYGWHLLWASGWAVAALVFALLGAIFTAVGFVLTIAIITAFVGLPFIGLGLLWLGLGAAGLAWRWTLAQKTLRVLRVGEPVEGQIVSVEENLAVRVNGRNPWRIQYQFRLNGQGYQGAVTTLNPPRLQPGQAACVLYLPQSPTDNVLYPHP